MATGLIAAVGGLALIGMVYPQRGVMSEAQLTDWHAQAPLISAAGEAVGLDHLFTTWYFVGMLLVVVMVTALCTLQRVKRHSGSGEVPARHAPFATVGILAGDGSDPHGTLVSVSSRLTRLRATAQVTLAVDDGGMWRALLRTGRIGFWGSVAFHLALMAIALGAVFSALTTFTGRAVVTEGQAFVDEPRSYLLVSEEPRLGTAYSGASLTLDRLEFIYGGNVLTRGVAHVSIMGGPGEPQRSLTGEVNYPVGLGGKSLLLGNSGYAVGLRVGAAGAVSESYYALGEREPGGYSDTVRLPGGVTADLYALPREGGSVRREIDRRYVLDEPVVHAKLSATGRTLWEGDLTPGVETNIDGYQIMLTDVRMWSEFLVRGDKGRLPVYIGLWAAVIGLAIRFADPDRRVLVIWDGGTTTVSARHRYGRVSSRAMVTRITGAVDASSDRSADEGRA
jgi:hypothetical protein